MKGIVGKLTLRHLKENKKRTIITIFGVIVSVAMITAVTTSVSSFFNMMGNVTEVQAGDWIGYYSNVDAEKIQIAKDYDNIADVVVCKDIGNYMAGGEMAKDGRNLLSVRAQPSGSFDHVSGQLVEGTFPTKPNEMMLEKAFIKNNKLDWKVGDTVTLSQLQRFYADGEGAVSQFAAYLPEEQSYEQTGQAEFKITGTFLSYAASDYNAVTAFNPSTVKMGETVDIYTTQEKLSFSSYSQAKDLGGAIGEYSSMNVHKDYLRYNGYLIADEAVTVYTATGIVMLIIMLASVTLIYNAFGISISERSRYLGMLASVGATRRQKRSTVYYEGAFIGAIGIPLGILAGIGGIGVTFALIGPMFSGLFIGSAKAAEGLKLVVSPVGILISVLLSVITILISAYLPGRRASRTTPIDALRGSKEITASAKKLKTSKLTRKLFGYEGELALKNIKRNRKKYRVIVSSLAISVILFLSVNAFTGMMAGSYTVANDPSPYDIRITARTPEVKGAMQQFVQTLDGIDSVESTDCLPVYVIGDRNLFSWEDQTNAATPLVELADGRKSQAFNIVSLPDDDFRQLCQANGVNAQSFFEDSGVPVLVQNYALSYIQDPGGTKLKEYAPLNVKPGQTLSACTEQEMTYNDNGLRGVPEAPSVQMSVKAVTTQRIYKSTSTQEGPVMLLPQSVFERCFRDSQDKKYNIFLYTENYEALDDVIQERLNQETGGNYAIGHMYNSSLNEQAEKQLMLIVNVFAYGFITLITMICVANIFNTVSTGIQLRRREFAMIKSVGMTPKGFSRMVAYESLFYGIKALLIGLPVSLLIHTALWKSVTNTFQTGLLSSINPWSYGIAVMAVFVIVCAALLYSVRKVRKDNIIETLKSEDN